MIKIKINGKEYPAYITMGAARRFKAQTGHDMSRMDASMDEACTYLFCVVQSACKREKVDFPYDSIDDFADNLCLEDFTAWSEQIASTQEQSGGE